MRMRQWGGHLASPDSDQEIKALTSRMRMEDYWIGYHRYVVCMKHTDIHAYECKKCVDS